MRNKAEKYDIIKFIDDEFTLDVKVDYSKDTVWLDQEQMARLFGVDRTRIVRHISNIYSELELDKKSTCAENAQVQIEGSRRVTRRIKVYNLDMIISVGYRVKSKRGIKFRKWATNILKDYLLTGIAINERKLDSLNKTVEIQNKMLSRSLNIDEIQLSSVIDEYTSALNMIDDYDHLRFRTPQVKNEIRSLTQKEVKEIIKLMRQNASSDIFGIEIMEGKIDGIICTINQTDNGIDLYKSLEEKAANLLYFLVKDHPFIDGCKRIAATIFLEYLNKNNALIKNNNLVISNDALCAITILAAESRPDEKEIIINVIMRMLAK